MMDSDQAIGSDNIPNKDDRVQERKEQVGSEPRTIV